MWPVFVLWIMNLKIMSVQPSCLEDMFYMQCIKSVWFGSSITRISKGTWGLSLFTFWSCRICFFRIFQLTWNISISFMAFSFHYLGSPWRDFSALHTRQWIQKRWRNSSSLHISGGMKKENIQPFILWMILECHLLGRFWRQIFFLYMYYFCSASESIVKEKKLPLLKVTAYCIY